MLIADLISTLTTILSSLYCNSNEIAFVDSPSMYYIQCYCVCGLVMLLLERDGKFVVSMTAWTVVVCYGRFSGVCQSVGMLPILLHVEICRNMGLNNPKAALSY